MPERPILRLAATLLLSCFIAAAHAATHIVGVNGVTTFTVNSGTRVSGTQVATVDDGGSPVAGHGVLVNLNGCGVFDRNLTTTSITSDANGIVALPVWQAAYGNGACPLRFASLTEAAQIEMTAQIVGPVAATLQLLSQPQYTVVYGGTLDDLRVRVLDASGNGIPGQTVGAFGSCGTFSGPVEININFVVTDSSGVATLPRWTAVNTTCFSLVEVLMYWFSNVPAITFAVSVVAPPPPPPTIATHFAMIDSSNTFYTTPGGTVTGVHFATVDNSQARVGNQAVTITALDGPHCGSFSGATTLSLSSDANGVLSLPAHTAAMSVTNCVWKAQLVAAPADYLVFYFNTGDPFAALTPLRLAVQNHSSDYTIASTGFLDNVEVAAIATSGAWIRQRGIQFTSMTPSCGSFGGVDQVMATTDEGGVAMMPRWTPSGQFADCVIAMDFTGTPGLTSTIQLHISGVAAPPTPVTPVTTATGTSPQGGAIKLTMVAATPQCSLSRASFIDPALISPPVAPAPEGIAAPHGLIDFRTDNCGSGQSVTFNVDFPQDLPPTAQWWKYGPTMEDRAAHWYVIPSTISGKRISFTINDGGLGDDDLMMNGSITDLGMLAIPNGVMQDLWWSGAGENGWGMSIVQHRDVLFANMFVYDASGAPTWYVMPDGSWNSSHTVYTGNLYLPKGSPFFAYDATKFDIGASVGTATLTFTDANNASFDYTISGVTGHKSITRILFGPQSPPTDKPLGDLWWAGSAQNGWGLAVLQQYSTLFALWFTYDANGKATWFVMPSGSWVVKDDYQGKIYRADGPPWLGVTYDVSRHHLTEAGTFRFRVTSDGATFDYTVDGHTGSIPLSRIPF